jgi:hypothetical protein
MGTEPDDGDYSPEEAKRRFEAALRTALATPPKPHKDEPRKQPKRGAAPGRDRAASSSSGGSPSASSSPRGRRGRP